jgi:hypothetical protein
LTTKGEVIHAFEVALNGNYTKTYAVSDWKVLNLMMTPLFESNKLGFRGEKIHASSYSSLISRDRGEH